MLASLHVVQVGSEDGMSEYGDTERLGDDDGISIWQELQNETIRLERKSSSSSEVKWPWTLNLWQWNALLYLCRPALTPWILLKISSQWRSTSEKSRRCCQCTCTREESPPLPSLDQRNNLKKLNLHNCVYLFIILCILVSNWKVLIKQWMAFLPKQINYE